MKDFEVEVVEQLVRSEVESRVEGGKLRPLSTLTEKNNHHRYIVILGSLGEVFFVVDCMMMIFF